MNKQFPHHCPSCGSRLRVTQLSCSNCTTQILGEFSLPVFSQLSQEDQEFIMDFVKSSGSLKLMAKQLNLSYPTVRNLLDDLIEKIKTKETENEQFNH